MISHLAFVNDILLFVEATLDHVEVIKLTLNLFCESAGTKVNWYTFFSQANVKKIKQLL